MKNDKSFLSYSTIVDAVHGQSDAVQEVLKHYDRYIITLATRTMFDAYGEPHLCIDITLKHRLESKLLGKISAFKLNKEI